MSKHSHLPGALCQACTAWREEKTEARPPKIRPLSFERAMAIAGKARNDDYSPNLGDLFGIEMEVNY